MTTLGRYASQVAESAATYRAAVDIPLASPLIIIDAGLAYQKNGIAAAISSLLGDTAGYAATSAGMDFFAEGLIGAIAVAGFPEVLATAVVSLIAVGVGIGVSKGVQYVLNNLETQSSTQGSNGQTTYPDGTTSTTLPNGNTQYSLSNGTTYTVNPNTGTSTISVNGDTYSYDTTGSVTGVSTKNNSFNMQVATDGTAVVTDSTGAVTNVSFSIGANGNPVATAPDQQGQSSSVTLSTDSNGNAITTAGDVSSTTGIDPDTGNQTTTVTQGGQMVEQIQYNSDGSATQSFYDSTTGELTSQNSIPAPASSQTGDGSSSTNNSAPATDNSSPVSNTNSTTGTSNDAVTGNTTSASAGDNSATENSVAPADNGSSSTNNSAPATDSGSPVSSVNSTTSTSNNAVTENATSTAASDNSTTGDSGAMAASDSSGLSSAESAAEAAAAIAQYMIENQGEYDSNIDGDGLAGSPAAIQNALNDSTNQIVQDDLQQGNGKAAAAAEAGLAQAPPEPGRSTPAGTGTFLSENAKWNTQGNGQTITWSFGGDSANSSANAAAEIAARQAFAAWSAVSGLTFVQTSNPAQADIKINWGNLGAPASGIVGQTTYQSQNGLIVPGSVNITLENPAEDALVAGADDYPAWSGTGATLEQVLLHEIGHALGLGDSTDPDSVMYYALTASNPTLDTTDVRGIQSLYGGKCDGNTAEPAATGSTAQSNRWLPHQHRHRHRPLHWQRFPLPSQPVRPASLSRHWRPMRRPLPQPVSLTGLPPR